ncbi:hypothetical protein ACWEV3_34195 [Saccharopolyspora sp. NPDC003752]
MNDLVLALIVVAALAVALGAGLWWLLVPNGVESQQPEGKE